MHGEALAMTLQALGLAAPPFSREPPRSVAPPRGDIPFAGGKFTLGARPDSPHFVFDNEKWAHDVVLQPFAIASAPATQGEFVRFVDDDGYSRQELWTPEGWAWREEANRGEPRYWKQNGDAWRMRRFDRWIAVDPHAPMVHVNQHEALAYCRWAGRRLPTEAEWEFAARNGGEDVRFPWGDEPRSAPSLDFKQRAAASHANDTTRSRLGLHAMVGGVWEWTASSFDPYPGFAPDPYRDYSEPWFGTHAVLRGGSFATRGRLAHNGLRNFYLPSRDDPFAGFRTCAGESS
jgi:iron(II)-dependent oxidoreductase